MRYRPERALTPRLYVVLGLLVMVAPLSTSLYSPGLPSLADSLDVSTSGAQWTISAAVFGLALGQLILGSLSDRFGRRLPVLIGISVFVVATVLCAIAPTLPFLIVVRFIQGFSGAAGAVIARATIRDLTSGGSAAQALSRLLMVVGVAPIIGPVLGGQVLRLTDWRGLFVTLAIASAISLIVAVLWFPETLAPSKRLSGHGRESQWAVMGRLLCDRQIVGFMGIIALMGVVTFSWMASGPFYFEAEHGMSMTVFSTIVGVASIGFVAGALVNSRLVITIGPHAALLRGLLLMSATSVALLLCTWLHAPVWTIVVFGIANMAVYGGMGANAQAMALTRHGEVAGSVSALLGSMQFIGGGLLPPIITLLVGGTWSMAVGMSLASVGALLVLVLVVRPVRRPASS